MKHLSKNVGVILGILLLGGLVFWLTQTLTSPPGDAPSPFTLQSPIIFQSPVLTPIPSPTATPISIVNNASSPISPPDAPPPPCQFEAEPSTVLPESESLLERYVFSEPKPVLDYEIGLNIFQWLPDSQKLLIRRLGQETKTSVEVFNPYANILETYIQQPFAGTDNSVWLESEKAVAFTDIVSDREYALYIAYRTEEIKQILTDLGSMYLSVPPDGKHVTFISARNDINLENYNASLDLSESISPSRFTLLDNQDGKYSVKSFKTKWHPDGKQLAYYSKDVFYLMDIKENFVCKLEIGSYNGFPLRVDTAEWSYDGRFLAILKGEPNLQFIGLFVIDTVTGEQKEIDIATSGNKYAVTWSPTSPDLLVAAQNIDENDRHNLYLVDVTTGKSRHILKEYSFWYNAYSGLKWSPNGKGIALKCPSFDDINDTKQLCLIEVNLQ